MTQKDRDELKRLEALVAPLPWSTFNGGNFTEIWSGKKRGRLPSAQLVGEANYRQSESGDNTPKISQDTAAFIVTSCNSVSDLLAENQRMLELLIAVIKTGCEAGTGDDIQSFLADHP